MYRLTYSLLLALITGTAGAQTLQLPLLSPQSTVTQVVGLTEMSVTYHRPSSKGRIIWGKLVPYDKLWRTGANSATVLTFSEDVTISGKVVPAGKYSLLSIPGESTWTIILNKNTRLVGTVGYKESEDQLRFTVEPTTVEYTETLTFNFSRLTESQANLDLRWDQLMITFPIVTNVQEHVKEAIQTVVESAWANYAQSANYYLDRNLDKGLAKQYATKSLALQEHQWNRFLLSRILAAEGDYRGAVENAERSLALAQLAQDTFYIQQNEKNLAEWRPLVGRTAPPKPGGK